MRITGDAAPGTTLGILLLPPRLVGFEIIDLRGYAGPSLIIVEAGYAADTSVTVHGGAGGDHVASAGFESESYVTLFEGGAGNDRFDNYLRQVVFRPGSGADTLSSPVGGSTVEMALADLDLADSFITDPFASGIIRFTAGGVLTQSLAYRFTGFDRLELGPAGVAITLLGLPFLSPEDRTPDHSAYLPVFGGAGKDRISAAGMSPVYIAGGGDNDTIIGSAALKVLDEIEVVADTLEGNEGNDLLLGGAGWDAISGGAGDDTIDAGAGNDIAGPSLAKVLSGGAGNDRILLGAGNDEFYFDAAETGRDTVLGGSGDDTIGFLPGGQIGDDVIAGGAGADLLEFFFYTDPLTLSAAVLDRVSGFEEIRLPRGADAILFVTDTLVESAGTTLVISSDPLGARTLMLDASAVTDIGIVIFRTDDSSIANALTADTLIGGGGADTIARDGGADLVMGGGGDDLIITSFPTAAIDPARLDGGAGIDTLRAAGPVNSAGFSFAQLTGFEIIELADDVPNAITFVAGGLPAGGGVQFRGGNDSDVLDAAALTTAVHLSGRAGDDMLFGGSAGDWLDAGTGTDLVMGGTGNDTIRLDDAGADDMADGGAGLDRLVLDLDGKRFGPAALASLTGFETLEVSLDGGRLVLSQGFVAAVGSGTFTLDLVTEAGGLGATLEGAQATARLDIRGGAGNESITGGRGADVISDGAGADRLRGGLGADRLVLAADGAADRVAYGATGEGSRDIAIAANPGRPASSSHAGQAAPTPHSTICASAMAWQALPMTTSSSCSRC